MSTIEEAKAAIIASSPESSVYVGCDSIRYSKKVNDKKQWFARYCTVIIVHKDSSHGSCMYHDVITEPDYGSIKQRMLREVSFAVQHALDILPYVGNRRMEVHIDINSDAKYKSNTALKEAIGYVYGTLGFEPKYKNQSWAATHCADHLVRYKN